MKRPAAAGVLLLLLAAGCDWLDWPDPLDYPYHGHRLIVHTSVIDSTAGHGTTQPHFYLALRNCEFRRPGSGHDVFAFDYSYFTVDIDSFNDPDTVDTSFVPHFDGLAQHLGGDTSHFARMDSRPGWEWRYRGFVADRGRYDMEGAERFMLSIPDTVTPEVHLRVEVVWPLLYESDRRGRLHYDLDYLRITRIDAD